MDVFDPEKRSEIMGKIRGRNTKPEELVRKYLFAHGIRYRKNDKRFPGSPDMVLPKYGIVIFVNGCFWHGHKDCKYYVLPKTNTRFWRNKIENNIMRDDMSMFLLEEKGWKVIIVWECELRGKRKEETLPRLLEKIRENAPEPAEETFHLPHVEEQGFEP